MSSWKPTHRITREKGDEILVMLDPSGEFPGGGPAYNEAEWMSFSPADYERQEDGSWTFQGQPFDGKVQRLKT